MTEIPVVEIHVAAGSNIQPRKYLLRALQALDDSFAPLTISPAYRNRAVGFEGADFINLVVGFHSEKSLEAVRSRLQEIEALCDRRRTASKWAPRTMDLDILLYGDQASCAPGLVLPRPDLLCRAYMLKPLADIAPNLVHPTTHKTIRELWDAFDASAHPLQEVSLTR